MKKLFPLFLSLVMLLGLFMLPASAEPLSEGAALYAEDATLIKSGYLGESVHFRLSDFRQALGTKKISAIVITSLPEAGSGTLFLASSRLVKGQSIPAAAINLLKFVPAASTVQESSFTFTAGNACGGAEIKCVIRLIEKKNEAPSVAEDAALSVTTQKGISYFGTLSATDPEGDALYFRVTSYPKRGTLSLLDSETGEFRYTPTGNYKGKDSFSYVVRDEYGNFSTEQTVSVKVKNRASSLVYEDVAGTDTELAAVTLTDEGVVLGRLSGDGMFFDPDKTVSRGDFTVMAMKIAGFSPIDGLYDTCFDDNESIPTSVRRYIATAQIKGYVNGKFDGTGLYFAADEAITKAEAAVIVCNVLGLKGNASEPVFAADGSIPTWAVPSLNTLWEMDVPVMGATEEMTRAEAVKMLYRISELMEK